MTTTVVHGNLHFKVSGVLIMELTRQAYWMENREEWALKTLRCLRGISEQQIMNVLSGVAVLKDDPTGERVLYEEAEDFAWQEELARHLQWQDERTYNFAGRRVEKTLVDHYTYKIVQRIRDVLRNPMAMRFMDPLVMMRLEEQRKEQHDAIFLAAGFTQAEVDERSKFNWSEEFRRFDEALSAHVDKEAGGYL